MSPTAAAGGVILNGTMTNAMVAVLHQFMMLVTLQELVRGDKFRGSKRTLVAGIISTTWSLLQEVDQYLQESPGLALSEPACYQRQLPMYLVHLHCHHRTSMTVAVTGVALELVVE